MEKTEQSWRKQYSLREAKSKLSALDQFGRLQSRIQTLGDSPPDLRTTRRSLLPCLQSNPQTDLLKTRPFHYQNQLKISN